MMFAACHKNHVGLRRGREARKRCALNGQLTVDLRTADSIGCHGAAAMSQLRMDDTDAANIK
jgi:hypothetical protein